MDVFELQASVKIDTTEANSKLDALLEKAKKIDDTLNNGGNGGDSGSNGNSNNGDNGDNSSNNNNGSDTDSSNSDGSSQDVVAAGKPKSGFKKALGYAAELGGGILAGAGGAFLLTGGVAVGLGKALYNEETDINKSLRVQNALNNADSDTIESLVKWIDVSNKITQGGFDLDQYQVETLMGQRQSLFNTLNGTGAFSAYRTYLTANDINTDFDILPTLEEAGIKLPAEVESETTSEDISEQIGEVNIPATVTVTQVNGGGGGEFFDTVGGIGQKVGEDVLGELVDSFVDNFFGKKDIGMPYVPHDGMAYVHEGERILTKAEASNYWRGSAWNAKSGYSDTTTIMAAVRSALGDVGIYLGSDQVGNLVSNKVGANINNKRNFKLRSMGG